MKVAFFQPYLASWRVEFLGRFINVSKHNIVVYDGGFSPKVDEKSINGNPCAFPVKRLKSWSMVFSYRGQRYPLYFSPSLFFRLVFDRPDCVITEGEVNFVNNLSIFLYCWLFGKSYVWWSLGKVRTRKKNLINRLLDPLVDFLLENAHCVMARNSYARDYYVKNKGICSDKVIVAPNSMDDVRARSEAVDVDSYLETEKYGRKVVLYVGALTSEKRPGDLVEVLAYLDSVGRQDIDVWVVGEGPMRSAIERRVAELGLENRCKLWGKVFSGVGKFFLSSDVVVVPGLGGLVINHAMIFGKPVISRVADGTELDLINNGENGFVVDDYDNVSLANAIVSVIDSPNYEAMCMASQRIIDQSWNMGLMIDRVEMCIAKACSRTEA